MGAPEDASARAWCPSEPLGSLSAQAGIHRHPPCPSLPLRGAHPSLGPHPLVTAEHLPQDLPPTGYRGGGGAPQPSHDPGQQQPPQEAAVSESCGAASLTLHKSQPAAEPTLSSSPRPTLAGLAGRSFALVRAHWGSGPLPDTNDPTVSTKRTAAPCHTRRRDTGLSLSLALQAPGLTRPLGTGGQRG